MTVLTYPFKDILFEFVEELNHCNEECNTIRSNRHGANDSDSIHLLKKQLKRSAAFLSDKYNTYHGRIGQRWEQGDEAAIYDIQKSIIQLRNLVLAPLRNLSQRRYKPVEAGITEIHDMVVHISNDVKRVVEYLAERLTRKKTNPDVYARDSYNVRPAHAPQYTGWDPMAGYYGAGAVRERPVYSPDNYYSGLGSQLYSQPPYIPTRDPYARDPYGGVVFVRRHMR